MKNKARVEGFICASYLHRETTHFCSHYFNNFMLRPQHYRNEVDIESEGFHQSYLSLTNLDVILGGRSLVG